MTNYAFFDVDQTIYPGYSMADFYLSPGMIARGGNDIYQQDLEIGTLYKAGQITYGEAGLRAAKLSASTVKGMSVSNVHALAQKFIAQKGVKDFVHPLFSLLHERGYTIILVSGSVDFIVRAIAEYSHADKYHATTPALSPDDVYTGEIEHQLDNKEKSTLIRSAYDLSSGTVLAFGDSTGDIPMLSLAHHAFIVNPHQIEMNELVHKHPDWHLVENTTIVKQVHAVLHSMSY